MTETINEVDFCGKMAAAAQDFARFHPSLVAALPVAESAAASWQTSVMRCFSTSSVSRT